MGAAVASVQDYEVRYPPAPRMDSTLYVIGDIHGRLDLLLDVQRRIDEDKARFHTGHTAEIYIGDYIDRGSESAGVVSRLIARGRETRAIFLRGNHEQMLLSFLDGDDDCLGLWRAVGGTATMVSYGVPARPLDALGRGGRRAAQPVRKDSARPPQILRADRGLYASGRLSGRPRRHPAWRQAGRSEDTPICWASGTSSCSTRATSTSSSCTAYARDGPGFASQPHQRRHRRFRNQPADMPQDRRRRRTRAGSLTLKRLPHRQLESEAGAGHAASAAVAGGAPPLTNSGGRQQGDAATTTAAANTTHALTSGAPAAAPHSSNETA